MDTSSTSLVRSSPRPVEGLGRELAQASSPMVRELSALVASKVISCGEVSVTSLETSEGYLDRRDFAKLAALGAQLQVPLLQMGGDGVGISASISITSVHQTTEGQQSMQIKTSEEGASVRVVKEKTLTDKTGAKVKEIEIVNFKVEIDNQGRAKYSTVKMVLKVLVGGAAATAVGVGVSFLMQTLGGSAELSSVISSIATAGILMLALFLIAKNQDDSRKRQAEMRRDQKSEENRQFVKQAKKEEIELEIIFDRHHDQFQSQEA